MASGISSSTNVQVIHTMLITPATFHHYPPYGLVPCIQVSVQYKICTVTVMMRVWKKEIFESCDELDAVCKIIGSNTNQKFCPGIEMDHYITRPFAFISRV